MTTGFRELDVEKFSVMFQMKSIQKAGKVGRLGEERTDGLDWPPEVLKKSVKFVTDLDEGLKSKGRAKTIKTSLTPCINTDGKVFKRSTSWSSGTARTRESPDSSKSPALKPKLIISSAITVRKKPKRKNEIELRGASPNPPVKNAPEKKSKSRRRSLSDTRTVSLKIVVSEDIKSDEKQEGDSSVFVPSPAILPEITIETVADKSDNAEPVSSIIENIKKFEENKEVHFLKRRKSLESSEETTSHNLKVGFFY